MTEQERSVAIALIRRLGFRRLVIELAKLAEEIERRSR